jgi:hypothetical protein
MGGLQGTNGKAQEIKYNALLRSNIFLSCQRFWGGKNQQILKEMLN